MTLGHEVAAVGDGFPQLFSGIAIIGQDGLHLVFVVGRGEKNAAVPGDRRRMPASRHIGLPDDVFRRAPRERNILRRSDAVSVGSAPPRPIAGRNMDRWEFLVLGNIAGNFLNSGHARCR